MKNDIIFTDLLDDIMENGVEVNTRNSVTMRKRNLTATFESTPLVSIRRTAWKNALREFEWFMSGSNNIYDLHEKVRHWWEPWANEDGWIHNNYGVQFRRYRGMCHTGNPLVKTTDQIQYLINGIKQHPYSRRNVISTWQTHDMVSPATPITNCHGSMIQFFVEPEDESLHLTMYQRSSDMVLGLPHNLIQYWAFLQYMAKMTMKRVGTFTWLGGDCHIYQDHYDMVKEMGEKLFHVKKVPLLIYHPSGKEFKADDFKLSDKYNPIITKNLKMTV